MASLQGVQRGDDLTGRFSVSMSPILDVFLEEKNYMSQIKNALAGSVTVTFQVDVDLVCDETFYVKDKETGEVRCALFFMFFFVFRSSEKERALYFFVSSEGTAGNKIGCEGRKSPRGHKPCGLRGTFVARGRELTSHTSPMVSTLESLFLFPQCVWFLVARSGVHPTNPFLEDGYSSRRPSAFPSRCTRSAVPTRKPQRLLFACFFPNACCQCPLRCCVL